MLGGLAGAELSLGSVALFTENMSAGRGWIIVLMLLLTNGRASVMLAALAIYAIRKRSASGSKPSVCPCNSPTPRHI